MRRFYSFVLAGLPSVLRSHCRGNPVVTCQASAIRRMVYQNGKFYRRERSCAVPFGHVTEGVKPLPYNSYFPSNTRIIPVVTCHFRAGKGPAPTRNDIEKINADGREAHPYGGPNSYGGGLLPPTIGYQIESIPLAGKALDRGVPKNLPPPKRCSTRRPATTRNDLNRENQCGWTRGTSLRWAQLVRWGFTPTAVYFHRLSDIKLNRYRLQARHAVPLRKKLRKNF